MESRRRLYIYAATGSSSQPSGARCAAMAAAARASSSGVRGGASRRVRRRRAPRAAQAVSAGAPDKAALPGIAGSVLDLVGGTPCVRLNRVSWGCKVRRGGLERGAACGARALE